MLGLAGTKMNMYNYCKSCNTTLVKQPDGSVACCCHVLDADSTDIPDSWKLTQRELALTRGGEPDSVTPTVII